MAARALLYLGETSSKCMLTTVQYHKTRMQVHSSWRQVRGFKRNRDTAKQTETAFSDIAVGSGKLSTGKLWKPICFTVAFSATAFVSATILQHERVSKYSHCKTVDEYRLAIQQRSYHSGWRGEAEKWWLGLTTGDRVFVPICFLNVLVFLGWRIPALKSTMLRYFCTNPSSSAMCWPMLFSTFSHYSILHLAANMYVLYSFSTIAATVVGREPLVAFYLTSGVVSSLASNIFKTAFNMPGLSLGASGAIMGVVSIVCAQYPDVRLSIFFLSMWTFTASSTIKALLAMDTLGCILGWRFMDHAAHLGGALYGIFWQRWGNEMMQKKRKPIIEFWHNIRS